MRRGFLSEVEWEARKLIAESILEEDYGIKPRTKQRRKPIDKKRQLVEAWLKKTLPLDQVCHK